MSVVSLPAKFQPCVGSSVVMDPGVVVDAADDGTLYSRALAADTYYDLDPRFPALERADYLELVAFFRTHRQAEILIELDGITYRARAMGGLRVNYAHGASMADCTIRMRGVEHV